MPNDFISRKEAYEAAIDVSFNRENVLQARDRICNIPTADVVPVVHANWEPEGYMDEYESPPKRRRIGYRCTRCGGSNAIKLRYCGRCGAKMDGGEHHAD